MNKKPTTFRICALTKDKKPVSDLFRVVKTKTGKVSFDKNHNIQGRGAYLSKSLKCILEAQKTRALSKSLRCKVDDSIYIELFKNL